MSPNKMPAIQPVLEANPKHVAPLRAKGHKHQKPTKGAFGTNKGRKLAVA